MNAQVIAPVSRWFRLILVVLLLTISVVSFANPGVRKIEELNFSKAEIPIVLKALADFSGANIVIGPAVKGEITIKLKAVTVEEALDIITKMTGLAYTKTDNTYLVNIPSAITDPIKVNQRSNEIVTLAYLPLADAAKALSIAFPEVQVSEIGGRLVLAGSANRLDAAKAFLSQLDVKPVEKRDFNAVVTLKYVTLAKANDGLKMTYPDVDARQLDTQQIVLTGEKARVEAAQKFLAELDVPAVTPAVAEEDIVEKTYRVRFVIPSQAKDYLEYTFRGKPLSVTYAPGIMDSLPAVQPAAAPAEKAAPVEKVATWYSRTLVLRGPTTLVNEALASLGRVDVESPSIERRCTVKRIFATQAIAFLLETYESRGLSIVTAPMTFVELIQEKDAADAAKAKSGSGNQVGTVVRRGADGTLNISEPVGDFMLRGPEEVVTAAMKTLEGIDVGPERVDKVVKLRFLKAADVKKQLMEMYASKGLQIFLAPSQRVEPFKPVSGGVKGDEAPSAGGTATDIEEIADLVLRGPAQTVELALAQITRQDVAPPQISIQTQIVSIKSSALKNLGVEWGQPNAPGVITTTLTEQPSGDPLELGRIVRSSISLTATLNALERTNKAKTINRPASVVLNGRTSAIHVGDKVYFEEFRGYDAQGNKIFSTSSIDTGVTLYVRPLVSDNGVITLEIQTGVTEEPVFRPGLVSLLPVISEATNTTVVQIRNGETLVIGGLMQTSQEEQQQRVPVLSRIPLVGSLFKSKKVEPNQSELLIMVTPSILTPGEPFTIQQGAVPVPTAAPAK